MTPKQLALATMAEALFVYRKSTAPYYIPVSMRDLITKSVMDCADLIEAEDFDRMAAVAELCRRYRCSP